jgi:hypothetical protein
MYKQFALSLLFAVVSCNLVAADAQPSNNQNSDYAEFVSDYTKLFGEKPGSEWISCVGTCNNAGNSGCGTCN